MNKDLLEDQWVEVREYIREKFSNLTDDDVRQINGRYDQLVNKIQQRYGLSKDQADAEIRKWVPDISAKKVVRETPYYQSSREEGAYRVKEKDGSSLLKWLLLIGLPVLFLLGYWAANQSNKVEGQRVVNEDVATITESPADQFLSQSIRRSIASNDTIAQNLDAIRIVSSNGVVTVSGTVASTEQRDAIVRFIQNLRGVNQVNNKLQVR